LIPIPEGFYLMSPRRLLPILRSPLLTVGGKLRLLLEPIVLRGPAASADRDPRLDESVASFARRRLGREVFQQIVQPLVAGIYTADAEKLSMAATMPQFIEFERRHGSLLGAAFSHKRRAGRIRGQSRGDSAANTATGARYGLFVAPTNGLQGLITALRDRLPSEAIHINTAVTSVIRKTAGWNLDLNPKSEIRGSTELAEVNPKSTFDAVIIAAPAHAAGQLLQATHAKLAAELAAIEYAGCAVISLGFRRSQIGHDLNGFGFVVPRSENRRIIAGSFASLKYPGRAPADHVLIRVFIGGALQPELLERPDDDLRRIAIEELTELLRITGEPLVTDIARWPRSMPQYHVGHLARVADIEQRVARYPTLALAGNAYRGVGIPHCVASGEAAAEKVVSALAQK
jgi:oxygen-dependent protoporphyrinogen oxidase